MRGSFNGLGPMARPLYAQALGIQRLKRRHMDGSKETPQECGLDM